MISCKWKKKNLRKLGLPLGPAKKLNAEIQKINERTKRDRIVRDANIVSDLRQPLHALELTQFYAKLKTDAKKGLSEKQVKELQKTYGPNVISDKILDAETKNKMDSKNIVVVRDYQKKQVLASKLVPGDVVELNDGDLCCADMRVVSCNSLWVDNYRITGRSETEARKLVCTNNEFMQSKNTLMLGAVIAQGNGTAIVTSTGKNTTLCKLLVAHKKGKEASDKEVAAHRTTDAIQVKYSPNTVNQVVGLGLLLNLPESAEYSRVLLVLKNVNSIVIDLEHFLYEDKLRVNAIFLNGKTETPDSIEKSKKETGLTPCLLACSLANSAYFSEADDEATCSNATVEGGEDDCGEPLLRFFEGAFPKCAGFPDSIKGKHKFYSEWARKRYPKVAEDDNALHISIHKLPEDPTESTDAFFANMKKASFLLVIKGDVDAVLSRCSTMWTGTATELTKQNKLKISIAKKKREQMGEEVIGVGYMLLHGKKYTKDFKFDFFPPNFPLKKFCFSGFFAIGHAIKPNAIDLFSRIKNSPAKILVLSENGESAIKSVIKDLRKQGKVLDDEKSYTMINAKSSGNSGISEVAALFNESKISFIYNSSAAYKLYLSGR
eukprot:TRINITY_DN9814_c0_g1_i3.p1 TRINITY_DN9814_c0_g1~~TRINITY_DN9814_c0_g1_i3.p1  ORF type:complete len:606 (-),score=107.63 TRINITY_DN9814_c0_g1_i3:455-2272(-)